MTPSEIVAGRIRAVRRGRGMTVAQLAKRCAEGGAPELTEQTLYNIEGGRPDQQGRRRRAVTVDELLALGDVLEVAPVHLLTPLYPAAHTSYDTGAGPNDGAAYQVTGGSTHPVYRVRQFIRGHRPLEGMDELAFFSEAPAHEREAARSQLEGMARLQDEEYWARSEEEA